VAVSYSKSCQDLTRDHVMNLLEICEMSFA